MVISSEYVNELDSGDFDADIFANASFRPLGTCVGLRCKDSIHEVPQSFQSTFVLVSPRVLAVVSIAPCVEVAAAVVLVALLPLDVAAVPTAVVEPFLLRNIRRAVVIPVRDRVSSGQSRRLPVPTLPAALALAAVASIGANGCTTPRIVPTRVMTVATGSGHKLVAHDNGYEMVWLGFEAWDLLVFPACDATDAEAVVAEAAVDLMLVVPAEDARVVVVEEVAAEPMTLCRWVAIHVQQA